jgi:integrase
VRHSGGKVGASMKKEHQFKSVLAPFIQGLIEQKRANGFSYEDGAYMLQRFDRFCEDYGLSKEELPRDLVMEWSVRFQNECLTTRGHRVSLIRQLAIYMSSLGLSVYMPKRQAAGEKRAPYILSSEELLSLFQIIDTQIPCYKNPLRFIEAQKIVYRLFYCCGLRLSEGRYLRRENVDLEQGVLKILHSKGDKDRLVFMAGDLTEMCRDYYGYICKECPDSPWFFPGRNPANPFAHSTLPVNFKWYWERTPYAKMRNKYPTIHSLRYTFVIDKINEWMLSGVDLRSMLPYLSRYLGHATIDDTLYYYHLVLRAFQVVRQKDTRSQSIIPEVAPYEE